MRTYEVMYIVRPNIEEDAKKRQLNVSTVSQLLKVQKFQKQKTGVNVAQLMKSMISKMVSTTSYVLNLITIKLLTNSNVQLKSVTISFVTWLFVKTKTSNNQRGRLNAKQSCISRSFNERSGIQNHSLRCECSDIHSCSKSYVHECSREREADFINCVVLEDKQIM